MEIILAAAYCFLFYYIIRRVRFFSIDSLPAAPGILFIVKCLAGVILGIIYSKYYTNQNDIDTYKFFNDSKIMFDALFTSPKDFLRMFTGIDGESTELFPYYEKMNSWLNKNPLYNDNRTIVRLNTFFRFFSLGYYNVHVIFLNFISFIGIFCLYKTFVSYCPNKKTELLFLTFLLPSVLFWGSGVLKDGILLTGFGLTIYSFHRILKTGFTGRIGLVLIAGIIILLLTKVYVIALLIPGLIAWWISSNSGTKKIVITFTTSYALYFIMAFNLYHFFPDFNIAAFIFYKQKNFIELGQLLNASMIPIPSFECSAPGIIKASPHAFVNTMFRPLITDIHGKSMILLSALENMFIILLAVLCIISISMKNKKFEPLVMLSILFTIFLFILIGLISPVMGANVRYRIVALPLLMFIMVYFYDREKLFHRIPVIAKLFTGKKE